MELSSEGARWGATVDAPVVGALGSLFSPDVDAKAGARVHASCNDGFRPWAGWFRMCCRARHVRLAQTTMDPNQMEARVEADGRARPRLSLSSRWRDCKRGDPARHFKLRVRQDDDSPICNASRATLPRGTVS